MKDIDLRWASEAAIAAIAREAAMDMKQGAVAVFPTETVYGIGCLMSDSRAVERVFDIKGRDFSKPLPVMVACVSDIEKAAFCHPALAAFEKVFMPGPLTVVLKKKECVSQLVSGGRETVAIRIPENEFLLEVLRELGEPIVATSANLSGHPAPVSYEAIEKEIKAASDIGIDMGVCQVGRASAIADLTGSKIKLLRDGVISLDMLEKRIDEYKKHSEEQ